MCKQLHQSELERKSKMEAKNCIVPPGGEKGAFAPPPPFFFYQDIWLSDLQSTSQKRCSYTTSYFSMNAYKYPTYPNRSDFISSMYMYKDYTYAMLNLQLTITTTYQLRTSYTHTYHFVIPHCYPNEQDYLYPFMFTTIQ